MRILSILLFVLYGAVAAEPTANSGECDLIDRDGETVLRSITFDIEAGRVCSGAGCTDAQRIRSSDGAYMFVTIDQADRMTVYYIPASWIREQALGYVHYSGNVEPYFLKNCRMP